MSAGGQQEGASQGPAIRSIPGQINLSDSLPQIPSRLLAVMEETMKRHFGFDSFRAGQVEIVAANLEGKSILSVKPTGSGKSFDWQLPALMRFERGDGVTVCVVPLISLMRDQVEKLRSKGIECAFFDSFQSPADRAIEVERIKSGRAGILYVSPERLCNSAFCENVLGFGTKNPLKIASGVVDEAHLILEWGKTFRYAYGRKLGDAFEKLGISHRVTCSATVTERAREEIVSVLNLGEREEFFAELDRRNLRYSVRHFSSEKEKVSALRETLKRDKTAFGTGDIRNGYQPTLIFCSSRRATEKLAEKLRSAGIPAAHYHAGMTPEDRLVAQAHFMNDEVPVMVCTSAFSMGVDKPNIRRVIHFHTPKSLSQYVQEAGRAGRDGRTADCQLWYQPEDIYRQIYFIASANPSHRFMKELFMSLWDNFLSDEQRKSRTPRTVIDFKKFFDREGDYAVYVPRKLAAFVRLIGCGALDVDGWTVTFHARPNTIEKLLPNPTEIKADRAADKADLMAVRYYTMQNGEDSLRGILSTHFRHDLVVDRVAHADLAELIDIDKRRLVGVLQLINRRDLEMGQVVRILTDERDRPEKAQLSKDALMALEDLSGNEIRSVVKHAAALGFIRFMRRGRLSFASMRRTGIDFLKAELPAEQHWGFSPSTKPKELQRRIGHWAERSTLVSALEPTYRELSKGVGSVELWRSRLEEFLDRSFVVLGESMTGRDLVSTFTRRKAEKVDATDARYFLSYLFRDPLERRADKDAGVAPVTPLGPLAV